MPRAPIDPLASPKQRLVLTADQKETLRSLYKAAKRTVDDLPYTDESSRSTPSSSPARG